MTLKKKPSENIKGKGEPAFSPFPTMFFYPIGEKLHHLNHTEIVVCKCFQLDKAKIYSCGKDLNLLPNKKSLQTTISNLMKIPESSPRGRKHCEKRRHCSLRAISPFLTVFLQYLYCRQVKSTIYKKAFKRNVGKRVNSGNQHFLLFPQGFLSANILNSGKFNSLPHNAPVWCTKDI